MPAVIHTLYQAVRSVAGTIVAVVYFIWKGVTWPFRAFGRLSKQWKVFLALFMAVGLLTAGGLQIKSHVRTSVHWQYWAQVLTGNWSPQQPQKTPKLPNQTRPDYISDTEYLYGVVAAVVVNLSSLGFLIKILWDVIAIKRRYLMNINEAILYRDQIIKQFMIVALQKNPEGNVKDIVDNVVKRANRAWREGLLAEAIPEAEARRIFEEMDSNPKPS